MRRLRIELDLLTPAERRDLANALLRAAWSATLKETRVLLLDLLVEADAAVLGEAADRLCRLGVARRAGGGRGGGRLARGAGSRSGG